LSIHSQEQVALLTDYDIGSLFSEAYHTLYANIRFNWDSEKSKQHTLLITTPSAYPSQATVAANVAIAAAQSSTPTILVDADLRTPGLEQRFGLAKSAGLRDLLIEETITPQKIGQYLRQTFISDLRLLSAGSATASEGASILLSAKLQDVVHSICQYLAEAESRPGIVVFNTPPVLAGPDASLIGTLVEQTILAIAKGRTTRAQTKQAQAQLQRAHVNLTGIVLLDI
jgi:capsular exopolysaccharide synthesis family protein